MGGKARPTPPDASAYLMVFERWQRATNPREKAVLADLKDTMLAEMLAVRDITPWRRTPDPRNPPELFRRY